MIPGQQTAGRLGREARWTGRWPDLIGDFLQDSSRKLQPPCWDARPALPAGVGCNQRVFSRQRAAALDLLGPFRWRRIQAPTTRLEASSPPFESRSSMSRRLRSNRLRPQRDYPVLRSSVPSSRIREVPGLARSVEPRQGWNTRAGLTLTEVLVATFVAVVGVLSLAALLPVGIYQIGVSSRADSAGMVGREAWRRIKLDGTLQAIAPDGGSLYFQPASGGGFNRVPTPPAGAYVLDPYGLSNGGGDATFPANQTVNSAPALPRYTIARSDWRVTGNYRPLGGNVQDQPLARDLFTGHLDGLYEEEIDPLTGRRARVLITTNTEALEFSGNYTWLITVNPSHNSATTTNLAQALATVSVVVFYKRPAAAVDVTGTIYTDGNLHFFPDKELGARAILLGGLGGGTAELRWGNVNNEANRNLLPRLRAGDWIMLYGWRDISLSANHAIFPKDQSTSVLDARWYQIVAMGDREWDPNSSEWVLSMSLQGPDWNSYGDQIRGPVPPSSYPNDLTRYDLAWVAVFDRVVGVYQKTIRLQDF